MHCLAAASQCLPQQQPASWLASSTHLQLLPSHLQGPALMTGPLIELRVAELAGVWPAHTVVDAHRRIEAARVVLRFARNRAHDAAFVRAAADCIPGLVAALGSEEQPVWSAALCLLSLACGVAHGSEGNSWAIAAAGGVEALSQLVLAHSSDATTLSNACSVPGADNGATAASGASVYGGGIAALARGLRAAASDADRLGWLIPLVSLAIHNPSHSCTTQILAAGVAPDVLQQLARLELTFGSLIVTFLKGIAEQHGWSAALAIAEQAAESLIQGRLSMPTAAKSCSTLATVLADMHRECKQKGRPFLDSHLPFGVGCETLSAGCNWLQQRQISRLGLLLRAASRQRCPIPLRWPQRRQLPRQQLLSCWRRSGRQGRSWQPRQQPRQPSGSARRSGGRLLRQRQQRLTPMQLPPVLQPLRLSSPLRQQRW